MQSAQLSSRNRDVPSKTQTPGKRCGTCGRPPRRSSEANRRLWALYAAMADKLRPDGKVYTPTQFHLYCRERFLGAQDYPLPRGKVMTIPNSTADLDTDAFTDYMAQVEALAAEHG